MTWDEGLPQKFTLLVDELPIADVVRVAGELDLSTSDELARAFSTLSRDPGRRLVLDLRDVSFIDSTTLGLLLQEARRREEGIVSILVETPELRRIFEITGLERHFDLTVATNGHAK